MANPALTLRAECKGAPSPTADLFLTLTITNTTNAPIPFPLEYLQKTGPSIKLTDTRTQQHTYLRTNLAPHELRQKTTQIPPHKSVTLESLTTTLPIKSK